MEPFYNQLQRDIQAFRQCLPIQSMEEFFGWTQASYNYIPIPLLNDNGFGLSMEDHRGLHLFNVAGCASCLQKEGKWFTDNLDYLLGQVHFFTHEYGHSFVNPTTREFWSAFEGHPESLDKLGTPSMAPFYKGNHETVVNEYIVRTLSTHFTLNCPLSIDRSKVRNKMIEMDRSMGFDHIHEFLELFNQYSGDRQTYPTIREFYPRIISFIKDL